MGWLLYGNGAMARVILSYVRQAWPVAALTVPEALIGESAIDGVPVVPFEDVERHYPPARHAMLTAVGYNQMNRMRAHVAAQCEAKGYRLTSYVDPWARLHDGVELGKNCVVLDFVSLHAGTAVGDHCFLSSQVNVGHDAVLGSGTWFNAGVKLAGHVRLGPRTVWGMNAVCSDRVTVGAETLVAPQAAVTRDVPAHALIEPGSPAPSRLSSIAHCRRYGPWQGEDLPCPD